MNSKRKGKRGELEAAQAIRDVFGVEARRGVQYHGGPDSPDLVTGFGNLHFEVKRVERLALADALQQAISDSRGKFPVVLWKKNRGPWVFIALLEHMPCIAGEIYRTMHGLD